jgi:hypothetical protein
MTYDIGNLRYCIPKFCTCDIVGHLRPPTISKVLYEIVELRYRSFEHDIVVSYVIGTYDIVGNYDIGGVSYDIGGDKVPDDRIMILILLTRPPDSQLALAALQRCSLSSAAWRRCDARSGQEGGSAETLN